MSTPRVFVSIRPSLHERLFTSAADDSLHSIGHVMLQKPDRNLTSAELAARLPGFDAVVAGWGTPVFTDDVLRAGDRLRLIAHTAGSIKRMLPPAVFERGVAVTHAASAVAPAVAEMALTLVLMMLRGVHHHNRLLKEGDWRATQSLPMGQEVSRQRIGVVGAGYIGRCFIELLTALGADVLVYDPYLSKNRSLELGARQVDLADLLSQCAIISLHAPATAETRHMIGARELSLLQDGAILINTARGSIVDQDALLSELQTGRISAALDVYDEEPLPAENPFRELDNVLMTPHISGACVQARRRQSWAVVSELQRFFSGQGLQYEVTREMLDIMA